MSRDYFLSVTCMSRDVCCLLQGYLQERAFIQTHSPQDGDVISFLSIVCQHHVSKIICLDTAADKVSVYVSVRKYPENKFF